MPREIQGRALALPRWRRRPRARCAPRRGVHVPHASRSRADRAGGLPDLRHGARATDGHSRCGGRQPGATRHDTTLLVCRGALGAAGRDRHARHAAEPTRLEPAAGSDARIHRASAGDARLPLVGVAILRPRRPVGEEHEPQHVHADRPRRERGVRLQRHRDRGAGCLPRGLPRPRR